jgi:hypothetical protein
MDEIVYSDDKLPFRLFGHPVSKRRIYTALQTSLAGAISCIFVVFPSFFPFIAPSIALLTPILAIVVMGLSHFAGSASKYAAHFIGAGLLAATVGIPVSYATLATNRWFGAAVMFPLTFFVTSWCGFVGKNGKNLFFFLRSHRFELS